MAKSKANKDKEEKNGSDTPQDDDDFGLPELEYEALDDDDEAEEETSSADEPEDSPLEDEAPAAEDDSKVSSIFDIEEPDQEEISNVFGGGSTTMEEKQVFYDADSSDSAKSFTRIIIFGAIAFVLIGFAFLYWHHKDDKEPVAKATPKVVEPKPAEPKPVEPTPEPVKKEPAKPVKTTGEVVTLSEKTGRSYVVVGSFFDGDLADDYGKQLASQGLDAKIIKPFGKSRFFRVSIADFDTYQEAMEEAEKAKSSYGAEVWALRY